MPQSAAARRNAELRAKKKEENKAAKAAEVAAKQQERAEKKAAKLAKQAAKDAAKLAKQQERVAKQAAKDAAKLAKQQERATKQATKQAAKQAAKDAAKLTKQQEQEERKRATATASASKTRARVERHHENKRSYANSTNTTPPPATETATAAVAAVVVSKTPGAIAPNPGPSLDTLEQCRKRLRIEESPDDGAVVLPTLPSYKSIIRTVQIGICTVVLFSVSIYYVDLNPADNSLCFNLSSEVLHRGLWDSDSLPKVAVCVNDIDPDSLLAKKLDLQKGDFFIDRDISRK